MGADTFSCSLICPLPLLANKAENLSRCLSYGLGGFLFRQGHGFLHPFGVMTCWYQMILQKNALTISHGSRGENSQDFQLSVPTLSLWQPIEFAVVVFQDSSVLRLLPRGPRGVTVLLLWMHRQ